MQGESVRILLVEDNPGDARLVLEGLKEAQAGFEVIWVDRLAKALDRLATQEFDNVLLDLNLPDSTGLETFGKLHEARPQVPVLLLTGLNDEGLALRAVQEGAQDFLVKGEVSGHALARAIQFAVERNRSLQWHITKSRSGPGGRVLTFVGAKGGVGTTTTMLNVAAAIAAEKLVIACEMRPDFGTLSAMLKRPGATNLSGLLVLEPVNIQEGAIEPKLVKSAFGFYVLFSPQKRGEFHEILPEQAERILRHVNGLGEFTLVDLPSYWQPYCEMVIRLSNQILLVTERDDASIAGAGVAIDSMRRAGISSEAITVIVVNQAPLVEGIQKERIEDALGYPVMAIIPPAPDVCAGAQRAGAPLVLHRPRSAPAAAFTALAQKLMRGAHTAGLPLALADEARPERIPMLS